MRVDTCTAGMGTRRVPASCDMWPMRTWLTLTLVCSGQQSPCDTAGISRRMLKAEGGSVTLGGGRCPGGYHKTTELGGGVAGQEMIVDHH